MSYFDNYEETEECPLIFNSDDERCLNCNYKDNCRIENYNELIKDLQMICKRLNNYKP